MPPNQNPEQIARDRIDRQLALAGWVVQGNKAIDFNAGPGVAVREYRTDAGPADYLLFVHGQAAGVIEAKAEEQGHKLTTAEAQSHRYAEAKLKWVNNNTPLPLVCEATGVITRLTDNRDPKPRAREIFNFPTPATVAEQLNQPATLRARLQNLPPLNPDGLRACQISAITNLEASFKADHPRALIQMATGSGKTFTAITAVYRLLKHAGARRVLTIQRLYSLLKDEPLDEAAEEANPAEQAVKPKQPLPVVYNAKIPQVMKKNPVTCLKGRCDERNL